MSDDDIDLSGVMNEQLVLIAGESAAGKSASLRNIPNQDRWLYLNCEAGKRLPFRNKFQSFTITDPCQIYEAFDYGQGDSSVDGIIIDTITFMMDMFESCYVIGSNNTQKAWGDYAQFFKQLMQQHVASFGKPVIMLGHTRADYNEKTMTHDVTVPVKGSLKNNGLEAFEESALAA